MEPTSDIKHLACLVMRFNGLLNVQLIGDVMALLREADLSLPRLVTLSYLHRTDSASISQIGDHLGLAMATTSHLVDQLVQGGYVERREAEQDRRHKTVSITDQGRDVVVRFYEIRINDASQQLHRLPPDLVQRLSTLLEEAIAALQPHP
ncbi:MarR family winged helix-turn-helix transcriptional regulator [Candidatus Oscillochloris fontis]|uniref:MarR family winged helix-turn-helix transcriptional regulator n=1 Tax=Candidatus Oscillochloris fontis TaxID=2496868 RepID=UPI00101CD2C5|nr:MarR family transcriptional regulator [Candidatus Oscillochloris fontis]